MQCAYLAGPAVRIAGQGLARLALYIRLPVEHELHLCPAPAVPKGRGNE